MAKKKKDKELTEQGAKIRAGKLLSQYLRVIAQENTELVKSENGEDRMTTKAEALVRIIFEQALGKEILNVKTGIVTKHAPNLSMIHLIWDRIEGRSVPFDAKGGKDTSIADRVGEIAADRINDI